MTREFPGTLPAPAVLDRIKQDTAGAHRRVERVFRILDARLTLATYAGWLERLLGLYLPLEAQIDPWGERLAIDWPARRKTPLLRRDLLTLGVPPERIDSLPVCGGLPVLADSPAVLGALYVLEGSTLGGPFIARHPAATLDLQAGNGAAFFVPYGSQWLTRWQAFRERLAAATATPEVQQRMIESARATFTAFERWLRRV